MKRRLLTSWLVLVVGVLIFLEVPLGILYARHERAGLLDVASRHATVIGAILEAAPTKQDDDIASLGARYAASLEAEVTIVDATGRTVTSRNGARADDNDRVQPRVLRTAIGGHAATGTVEDDGRTWLAAASPIRAGGRPAGAVLVSLPADGVAARVRSLWLLLGGLALALVVVTLAVAWRMATWITKPLAALTAAALQLGRGDSRPALAIEDGPPEIRSLAVELHDAAARLEQLVELQRQFLDQASHQLRTPLTALRLRIENLDETGDGSDERVAGALAEADRLSRLLDGLLTLSRVRGRRVESEPVDVAAVVQDRASAWKPLAEERGITLHVAPHAADHLVTTMAPGALEQVLDNILANGVDASPAGSTITVTAAASGAHIEIGVTDQGPGMPVDARDHAFERFWQGSPQGTGSGLGLAIVHELISNARGSTELHEAAGGGLHVAICLPRSP